MDKINKEMPESVQLNRLKREQDDYQIVAYNQKVAQDAKDYVSILNSLFLKKVGGK